jgi:putative transposase
LSVREQCRLLGVPRSTLYYEPCGPKALDLAVMRRLDEQYTATPYYGVERMTACLRRQGFCIGHNRVRRLLRGLRIERPNQVWSSDITYIRLSQGFVYLVAILDWFSRYVLSWLLSTTLDAWFCVQALREALRTARPEICNTDQGSQFTSAEWTQELSEASVAISMDGRGRVFDNIFTERLWRSVKYEEVYPKNYENVEDARRNLGEYFALYNQQRPHQALDYRTPAEVHFGASLAKSNNVTGVNKKEKEAKRKKMLLLQNTTLKN